MSRRRLPAEDTAPAGHDPQDPTTWDLSGAVIDGTASKWVTVITEAIRRSGASSLELGYEPSPLTGEDPEPGQPAVYYCKVEIGGRTLRTTCIGHPPAMSYERAQIEACVAMVRELGGRVTIDYQSST